MPTLVRLLLPIFLLLGTVVGCAEPEGTPENGEAARVLAAARARVANSAAHRYRFVSYWDNRFANSTYADSMEITYSRLPGNEPGFGFLVRGEDRDLLYDGTDLLRLDHRKRLAVRIPAVEIGSDGSYFASKMYFMASPRDLPDAGTFDRVARGSGDGRPLWTYRVREARAGSGAADTTFTDRTFHVDAEREVLVRVRKATHTGSDTAQIIDIHLKDLEFLAEPYAFDAPAYAATLGYPEITAAAAETARLSGLIKPGTQLRRADYPDVRGEERLLYGTPGRRSVVMFGFIGCGGCTVALRELGKNGYRMPPGLDFYYSSPVDAADRLLPYLAKKDFPHPAFGEESHMNDIFRVAAFPTFVFLSETGTVERVIGGFDGEVRGLLTTAPPPAGPASGGSRR